MSELSLTDAQIALANIEDDISETDEALLEARRAFDQAIKTISEKEKEKQRLRGEATLARQRLARAEALAAAKERTDAVDEGVEKLSARFLAIAEDKPWFTGVQLDEDGNITDPILPHQWQAVQFGAVAERFILADGVGLGKTRETIGWLDLVGAKKVLVVAEANIVNQFAGEIIELAPHRTIFNLAKKLPAKRHAMLDAILELSEAIVVVNYEIWRRDKDALAKMLDWEIDTIIVDEAHNLKTTSTANFGYVKTLISMDNLCPKCGAHLKGLWDPEALKLKKKKPKPCESCGWKVGDDYGKRFANKLDALLSSRSVKNVCFTTGTPILNDPQDLFSLLTLVNPILFPSKKAFQDTFLTHNYVIDKWEFRDGALNLLKPLIEGIFIQRTLEDTGVVLPPQHVNLIPVELDPKEYPKQYRTIKQITEAAEIILDSGESLSIMHLIALITRKRQANVWPGGIVVKDTRPESPTYGEVLFDAGTEVRESVKIDVILDTIRSHPGARQVVFSQFKTALSELEVRLKAEGYRVARFDGDTPEGLRTEIKDNFNRAKKQEPKWDIVLANYKTGGTGLNFTEATVTHILDEEWNPGKRNQAYGRTRRIGQTEETFVYVYRIRGTVDTWMANTIARKERIIDGFNDTMAGNVEDDLLTSFRQALQTGEIL